MAQLTGELAGGRHSIAVIVEAVVAHFDLVGVHGVARVVAVAPTTEGIVEAVAVLVAGENLDGYFADGRPSVAIRHPEQTGPDLAGFGAGGHLGVAGDGSGGSRRGVETVELPVDLVGQLVVVGIFSRSNQLTAQVVDALERRLGNDAGLGDRRAGVGNLDGGAGRVATICGQGFALPGLAPVVSREATVAV